MSVCVDNCVDIVIYAYIIIYIYIYIIEYCKLPIPDPQPTFGQCGGHSRGHRYRNERAKQLVN